MDAQSFVISGKLMVHGYGHSWLFDMFDFHG